LAEKIPIYLSNRCAEHGRSRIVQTALNMNEIQSLQDNDYSIHILPGGNRGGVNRPREIDMTLRNRVAVRLAGLTLAVFLLGACAAQAPIVQFQSDMTPIEAVAIAPFENLAQRLESGTSVRSPISGWIFVTNPVSIGADRFLTGQLVSHVQRDTAFEILPPGEPAALPEAVLDSSGRQGNLLEQLSQRGRGLGADAVFAGHVYRFRERAGGELSVQSPASVGFEIFLIDCRQPRVLWSAVYDYTQQGLSDNLLGVGNFFRRGGRWVTAEELATGAMDHIFDDFRRRMPSQTGIDSGLD